MKSRVLTVAVLATLLAALVVPQLTAQEQPNGHIRYKLIVIGTFGGPQSGLFFGDASALSNRGAVVGQGGYGDSRPEFWKL